MKFLKQLSLFALLAVLAFASCKKEEVFTTEVDPPIVTPNENQVNGLISRSFGNEDGIDLGCISIDYPFQMLLADSSTIIEIASEDDFIQALENETNPPLDFVYPLNVTDQDGNALSMNNIEELAGLFADCVPNTGWGDEWFFPAWIISYETSCYQLVYPVTLLDTDSVAVTANDEAELVALLANGDIYSFGFPLQILDENGNAVTAADQDDLFDLLAECSPNSGPGGCGIGSFGCYQLGYPVTLLLADGSSVVVNDDNEYAEVAFSGEWVGFGFPLNLIDENGNVITVNSEEELEASLLNCSGFGGGPTFEFGDFLCYNIAYPFSVTDLITSVTVTFNNSTEWNDFQNSASNAFDFVYPITLIHVETGAETTVQNYDELNEAISECFSGTGGGGPGIEFGEFICYDFVYPFSVTDLTNGSTITFADSDAWNTFQYGNPNGPNAFEWVYPLTLTHVETGIEVTVDNDQELVEAIEECF